MNNSVPIYRHNCVHCTYLGLYAKVGEPFADLYLCVDEERPYISSVVARFSDNGPDYTSCPIGYPRLTKTRALHEAMLRATELV